MQRRENIRTINFHTVNDLLGEETFARYRPLTRLIIQIAGDDDELVSMRLQKFRHLEMTRVTRLIGRNKGLVDQRYFHRRKLQRALFDRFAGSLGLGG